MIPYWTHHIQDLQQVQCHNSYYLRPCAYINSLLLTEMVFAQYLELITQRIIQISLLTEKLGI